MNLKLTRRQALSTAALLSGSLAGLGAARADVGPVVRGPKMTVTLNSSTIRPTPTLDKVRIAAEAGYDGIELWIDELERWEESGRPVEELGRIVADHGLFVPNIIGLWNAMPAEAEAWPGALERSKRWMDLSARVGALHVAAIPAPDRPDIDLLWAADKYRQLLDAGQEIGITVAVEFIGFMQGVHRLGQAVAIGIESRHPKACMVADTFHCFRGGSMFEGLAMIQGSFIAVMHFNDVPSDKPQFEQGDADRVLPGDGILPLVDVVRTLASIGFGGPLSLEIFNQVQWERPPLDVARDGLRRIHRILDQAGVGHS